MNEKDLDALMRCPDEKEEEASQLSFQKKIRRSMKRTLYNRVFSAILMIVLAGVCLFFGTSAVMNMVCYAPSREEAFLEPDDFTEDGEFRLLIEDTARMLFPEVRCFVVDGSDGKTVQSRGFGTYDVDMKILGLDSYIALDGVPTHQFRIQRSRLDTGYAPFSFMLDEFLEPSTRKTEYDELKPERMQEKIEDLPASAYLDVSVSFQDYLTSEQVAELIRKYPGVSFEWAALKGQNLAKVQGVAAGMFLGHNIIQDFTEEAEQKYPGYYLFFDNGREITGKDLEQCLISRLQLLCDHPDFLKMAESRFGEEISPRIMKMRLENAKKEWACYGLRILADRDSLLKIMEEVPLSQLRMNDVKVSIYSK